MLTQIDANIVTLLEQVLIPFLFVRINLYSRLGSKSLERFMCIAVKDKLYNHIDEDGNQIFIYYGIVGHHKRKVSVENTYQFYLKNVSCYNKWERVVRGVDV